MAFFTVQVHPLATYFQPPNSGEWKETSFTEKTKTYLAIDIMPELMPPLLSARLRQSSLPWQNVIVLIAQSHFGLYATGFTTCFQVRSLIFHVSDTW